MAVFGSVVPFVATFASVKRYGATDSALPGYVIPVVAASLGVVMLGEAISVSLVLASVAIGAGVLLITGARRARP